MNRFYKGRYLIALYYGGPSNDEYLYGVYNNATDLAQQANRDIANIMSQLSKAFKGENNRKGLLVYEDNEKKSRNKYLRTTIHFIELTDKEIESGDYDNE